MQIELAPEFENPKDCQAIIAIQGSRKEIIKHLKYLLAAAELEKPIQGIFLHADSQTQVITPVWNGKKY